MSASSAPGPSARPKRAEKKAKGKSEPKRSGGKPGGGKSNSKAKAKPKAKSNTNTRAAKRAARAPGKGKAKPKARQAGASIPRKGMAAKAARGGSAKAGKKGAAAAAAAAPPPQRKKRRYGRGVAARRARMAAGVNLADVWPVVFRLPGGMAKQVAADGAEVMRISGVGGVQGVGLLAVGLYLSLPEASRRKMAAWTLPGVERG